EKGWSGRRDLNPRPYRPERYALPSCATPRPKARMPSPGMIAAGRPNRTPGPADRGVVTLSPEYSAEGSCTALLGASRGLTVTNRARARRNRTLDQEVRSHGPVTVRSRVGQPSPAARPGHRHSPAGDRHARGTARGSAPPPAPPARASPPTARNR